MIDKILSGIGNSSKGQQFFKWASQASSEKFLNNTIPQLETLLATGCYVYSTSKQKNIDKEQRDLLQIQNVASGIVGITIASVANRAIGRFGDSVIKHLDTNKINPNSIKQISTGLRIGLPIATTAFCMRFLIPSCIALFSGKVMDKIREKRKLDIKA